MIGATAGDIIGSVYEYDPIKTEEFLLFGEGNSFTDDTLAQIAAEAGVVTTYRRFAVTDLSVPTPLTMLQILDHLDTEVATGRPVYVHCLGGKGRTGTVVGCTLLRHAKRLLPRVEPASPQTALEQIVRLRATQGVPTPWDSPQTVCQFEFVRSWMEGV